jgi:hypothetical protein
LEACQELANLQASVGELTLEQDKEDSWSFVRGTKSSDREITAGISSEIFSPNDLPAIGKTMVMDRLNTSDNTAQACDLTDRRGLKV